jgi:hypothetical protein
MNKISTTEDEAVLEAYHRLRVAAERVVEGGGLLRRRGRRKSDLRQPAPRLVPGTTGRAPAARLA